MKIHKFKVAEMTEKQKEKLIQKEMKKALIQRIKEFKEFHEKRLDKPF
jgi:histidinol dehydrogenase